MLAPLFLTLHVCPHFLVLNVCTAPILLTRTNSVCMSIQRHICPWHKRQSLGEAIPPSSEHRRRRQVCRSPELAAVPPASATNSAHPQARPSLTGCPPTHSLSAHQPSPTLVHAACARRPLPRICAGAVVLVALLARQCRHSRRPPNSPACAACCSSAALAYDATLPCDAA